MAPFFMVFEFTVCTQNCEEMRYCNAKIGFKIQWRRFLHCEVASQLCVQAHWVAFIIRGSSHLGTAGSRDRTEQMISPHYDILLVLQPFNPVRYYTYQLAYFKTNLINFFIPGEFISRAAGNNFTAKQNVTDDWPRYNAQPNNRP